MEAQFSAALDGLSHFLEKALSLKLPLTKRLEIISELRQNRLFDHTGISFLIGLDPARMAERYHVDLNLSSNQAQIDFEFGNAD